MSSSDLSPTKMPDTALASSNSEKKPRDTTNRLEVRMHKSTTFLAFAYKGTLWEFFPRGTFNAQNGAGRRVTTVNWSSRKVVTPFLFGLFAKCKTPYRASKGEQ